jgi:prepilin-type N-terminal cleavage/methylation domain-containing protein/prepilin-type processing-associated H-X9-DG protein
MNRSNDSRCAFTMVELLVVVAVFAVFCALLLPAFAQDNKSHVQAIRCLDNHSQLIKAWHMYAVDSEDYVANNYTLQGTLDAINKWKTTGACDVWAPNIMSFAVSGGPDATSITNVALAQAGLLASYHRRDVDVYRCPEDSYLSRAQQAVRWKHRMRSVSMNSNWGRTAPNESKSGSPTSWAYGGPFRQWHRTAEVRKPAARYVFVDEHADSINDGFFVVNWGGGTGEYPATSSSAPWGDVPGFYHNKGTPFGFADGHTEMKKWLSRHIPVRADGNFSTAPANIRDQQWYVQHVAERL